MRRILLLATLMAASPAVAQAQASSLSATATVSSYSAVTGSGDIAFGVLSRTTDNTVNAAGGPGAAIRTLNYNHNVRVTFSGVPAALTANGGALTLPVTLTCAARAGNGAWTTPVACGSAQLDVDASAALSQATLGFGGTITAASTANAVAATYTGTFNIVVTAR